MRNDPTSLASHLILGHAGALGLAFLLASCSSTVLPPREGPSWIERLEDGRDPTMRTDPSELPANLTLAPQAGAGDGSHDAGGCAPAPSLPPPGSTWREEEATEATPSWRFRLTPYLWFPSLSGQQTVRGREITVGESAGDVLDMTDQALMATFSGLHESGWGVYSSVLYSNTTTTDRVGNLKVRSESEQTLADLAISRRVVEEELSSWRSFSLDVYGGARYQNLNSKIALGGLGKVRENHDWVEPLVGAYFRFQVVEDFAWDTQIDFSGFGLGSGSDLTSIFYSGVDIALSETLALRLGYRSLDLRYSQGSGSGRFAMDLHQGGLAAGLSFQF